jgi:hypothetical protein
MTTVPTPTPSPQDYDALAIDARVKQINEEYAIIRAGERRNLPKAISIGEKLIDLRPRVSKHGEWQDYLKKHCPALAYETAAGYIRLAEKQEELCKLAKVKSVADADLTIREALKLLAKPKSDGGKKSGDKSANLGAVREPAASAKKAPPTLEDFIRNIAADELFEVLRKNYEAEQLSKLSELLRGHLLPKAA